MRSVCAHCPSSHKAAFNHQALDSLCDSSASVLAVYSLWLALEERETKARHQAVRAEAYALLNLIEVDLEQRIRSLQRFVFRWQQRGGMSRNEFLFEAASYLGDHPDYQALEWVDPNFKVRWVVPEKGNEEALGLNLVFEEQRRTALKLARHQKIPTLTAPIELVQGGVGFLVYLPIFANDHFDGFLLAVFRTESGLNHCSLPDIPQFVSCHAYLWTRMKFIARQHGKILRRLCMNNSN